MTNICDLANELKRGTRAFPKYKKAEESRVVIETDAAAEEPFKEFIDFQQGLHAKLQSGQMPTGDEQTKMQELGARVETGPVPKTYLDTQRVLSTYVSDIGKIVFGPLQDLLK